jgi:hypothetical protein
VVKTFHLEISCTGVAGFTRCCRLNVIDRLGRGAYPCANCVTTGAVLGGVLEYAVNVALFALECAVNILQDESGLSMFERRGTGCSLCLNRKTKQKHRQNYRSDFDDAVDFE